MGYDAATMGNYDFDAGLEKFRHYRKLTPRKFSIWLSVTGGFYRQYSMEHKYQPYKNF